MIINKKIKSNLDMIINCLFICIISVCLLIGIYYYTQVSKYSNESNIYVTITENNSDENELSSIVGKIGEKNKIQHILTLNHNAQYSLAYYDETSKKVYYMTNEDSNRHGGDQLFCYDTILKTNNQITKDLFGANYIIPVNTNKLFMVVAKKNTHTLEPVYINVKNGKVIGINCDDDLFVNVATKDNSQGEIYISGYSNLEDYKMLDKCNSTDKEQMYGIDNTVYKVKNNQLEKMFTLSDRFIDSFAVNENYIICNTSLRGTGSNYNSKLYLFDINLEEIIELKNKIEGNIFALDNKMNVLVNTGSKIKKINIKTGKLETLLPIDSNKAWINNANNYQ